MNLTALISLQVDAYVMAPMRVYLSSTGTGRQSGQQAAVAEGPCRTPCVAQWASTMWVKIADCHEGAKDVKAVTRIMFCPRGTAEARHAPLCACCDTNSARVFQCRSGSQFPRL